LNTRQRRAAAFSDPRQPAALIILGAFAFTGAALAILTAAAAIATTVIVAAFVALVTTGVTRDRRAGVLFAFTLAVFTAVILTYGPFITAVVARI
jgi:hypothetical protein